jgi:hypothetical protein
MKPKIFITVPLPEKVENYIAGYCEIRKWTGDKPFHVIFY